MARQSDGGTLKRLLRGSTSVAALVLGLALATPAAAQIVGGNGVDAVGSTPGGGGTTGDGSTIPATGYDGGWLWWNYRYSVGKSRDRS
jgi:hypothetical protein